MMYSLHLQFGKGYYLPSFTLQGVKAASLSSFLPGLERRLYFYLCFLKGSNAGLKKSYTELLWKCQITWISLSLKIVPLII